MKYTLRKIYSYLSDDMQSFSDAVYAKDLKHLASDIGKYGVKPIEIQSAIKRALSAFKTLGETIPAHFKPVKTVKNGQVFIDWKLSDKAFKVVLLNINPSYRVVAQLQLQLAEKF